VAYLHEPRQLEHDPLALAVDAEHDSDERGELEHAAAPHRQLSTSSFDVLVCVTRRYD
jgi:hypothetical protein